MISLVIPLFIGLPLGSWREVGVVCPFHGHSFFGFPLRFFTPVFFLILPDKKVKFALGMSNVHWSKVNLNAK